MSSKLTNHVSPLGPIEPDCIEPLSQIVVNPHSLMCIRIYSYIYTDYINYEVSYALKSYVAINVIMDKNSCY